MFIKILIFFRLDNSQMEQHVSRAIRDIIVPPWCQVLYHVQLVHLQAPLAQYCASCVLLVSPALTHLMPPLLAVQECSALLVKFLVRYCIKLLFNFRTTLSLEFSYNHFTILNHRLQTSDTSQKPIVAFYNYTILTVER